MKRAAQAVTGLMLIVISIRAIMWQPGHVILFVSFIALGAMGVHEYLKSIIPTTEEVRCSESS